MKKSQFHKVVFNLKNKDIMTKHNYINFLAYTPDINKYNIEQPR